MSLGARPRTVTTWYLTISEDGSYEVAKRGRPLLSGVSAQTARRYLREHRRSGDKAYIREPDGYLTPL